MLIVWNILFLWCFNVHFSWSNKLQMDKIQCPTSPLFSLNIKFHSEICPERLQKQNGLWTSSFQWILQANNSTSLQIFTLHLCVFCLLIVSYLHFEAILIFYTHGRIFFFNCLCFKVCVCAQLASALTAFTSLTVCVSERWWWHVMILAVAGCPLEVAASVMWSYVRGGALKVVGGESTSYVENGYAIEQWVCACVFMPVFECTDVPSAWQSW